MAVDRTLLLFLLLCLGSATAFGQVSSAERTALIDFYHATDGDNWRDNTGWLSDDSVCEWHGIECSSDGDTVHVRRILLPENRVASTLPDLFDHFTALETLDLGGNDLHGELPPGLIHVDPGDDRILSIRLENNRLGGSLPAFDSAFTAPGRLVLARNLFSGRLPESWGSMAELVWLDLSGNSFSGSIPETWATLDALKSLNLSHSALIGTLPEVLREMTALEEIRLAGNELVGELPEWFGQLRLRRIDLGDNALSGSVGRLFEALDPELSGYHLHVAGNRFSGSIPAQFDYARFATPARMVTGTEYGLDLCWNPIDVPESLVIEDIESVHRGKDLLSCLWRERRSLDTGIAGSWFDPERSGEGTTQMLLPDGTLLAFWFTYQPAENNRSAGQAWHLGMTHPYPKAALMRPLAETTGGHFDLGLDSDSGRVRDSMSWLRIDRLGPDTQQVLYQHTDEGVCLLTCYFPVQTQRLNYTRLTRLAGTTCDNQRPRQWISGLWHDPERESDGFVVEVNEDGRGVVYWFTYTADGTGEQAWMTGDGHFDGNTLHVDNLIQPRGGLFGEQFDSDMIERTHWGSLTLEFHDDMNAHIHYDSVFTEYGSGDYPLERLARPKLAECD